MGNTLHKVPGKKRIKNKIVLKNRVGNNKSQAPPEDDEEQQEVNPVHPANKNQKHHHLCFSSRRLPGNDLKIMSPPTSKKTSNDEKDALEHSPSQQKRVKVGARSDHDQGQSTMEDDHQLEASDHDDSDYYSSSDDDDDRRSSRQSDLARYIPPYLTPYVHPCRTGDFCVSRHFHPQFITQLMAEGFLPMCSHDYILLPKLHQERCCILLQRQEERISGPKDERSGPQSSCQLHTGKSTRKKAKNYTLTLNTAWNEVVDGCQEQHGDHCWLYPPLVQAFDVIHEAGVAGRPHVATVVNHYNTKTKKAHQKKQQEQQLKLPVRLHSVELWTVPKQDNGNNNNNQKKGGKKKKGATNPQTKPPGTDETNQPPPPQNDKQQQQHDKPRLVAGEIGYSVGGIYTSLTGFTKESSAGSIQLAALGSLLRRQGFCVWDLGMMMDYKQQLGATGQRRAKFVQLVHQHRGKTECELVLEDRKGDHNNGNNDNSFGRNARALIDEAAAMTG